MEPTDTADPLFSGVATTGVITVTASPRETGEYFPGMSMKEEQLADALAKQGIKVSRIPVTRSGIVDVAAFERMLDKDVRVVSCMAVNNELGTVQPLEEIGRLLKRAAGDSCR